MRIWMIALLVNVLLIVSAHGAPALFADNVLTIEDAIVLEGDKTRYYQNIRLSPTPDGDFKVVGAVEKSLVTVTDILVRIEKTNPVQVEVVLKGYMANPCVEISTAVTRKGSTFYVVVAQTPLQTLVACAQVIKPFELKVPLEVKGLASGKYIVMGNSASSSFALD